jgi:transcriptional regulator with XRE-family HTH domain
MKLFSVVSDEEIELQYKSISENVKRIRVSKKITQEDIALNMGFTTATFYTNAENYKQNKHFNLEHLIKIAYILDCDIKDLL